MTCQRSKAQMLRGAEQISRFFVATGMKFLLGERYQGRNVLLRRSGKGSLKAFDAAQMLIGSAKILRFVMLWVMMTGALFCCPFWRWHIVTFL